RGPPGQGAGLAGRRVANGKKKRPSARQWRRGAGSPPARPKPAPPIAACSAEAEAMTAAAASQVTADPGPTEEAVQRLSRNEPRKVHGKIAGPPISIAAMAIPAGGKIGDA